jgi:hypothetical protein
LYEIHEFTANFIKQFNLYFLLTIRYLYPKPLDDLFYQSLFETTDIKVLKEFAKLKLKEIEKETIWTRIKRIFHDPKNSIPSRIFKIFYRKGSRLLIFTCLFGLSFMPILGIFVWNISSFFYFYQLYGFHGALLGLVFGKEFFIYVSGLRMFCRDLLEPFMGRVNSKVWFKEHQWFLYGFCYLASYFSNGYFAPVVFGIMQCSIALCLDQKACDLLSTES